MNIKTYITLSAAVLILSSCNNILDKDELDVFTNNNFWTSENKVKTYANTFYEDFAGYGNGAETGDFYFKTLTDDQCGSAFTNWTFTAIPATSSQWNDNWKEIRRANIMIEKINGMSQSQISNEAKAHWLGFARLMRGFIYYRLVRMYGDLPWINKALDITDDGFLYASRISRDVIMDSVLTDVNFACGNMRSGTSKTALNKACANAVKAEICLYEGTFRKYRSEADGQTAPDLTGSERYLKACRQACLYVMDSCSYSLNSNYQSCYNSTDLNKSNEIILYKNYEKSTLTHSLVDYTCSSTQIYGMTRDAFNSYLFADGKPLALTNSNKSDSARMVIVKNDAKNDTVMSISALLAVRDRRLSQTIDTALCYTGRTFVRYGVGIAMTSSTGYGVSKFDNPDIELIYRNQYNSNFTDAPIFWLAPVLLADAEAGAELGIITQAELDRTVNLLKSRAGLPPLTVTPAFNDPANNMNVSSLIWEIRRERRCELMFDMNARYWDLIRWHQLKKLDSATHPDILTGANIAADPTAKVARRDNGTYIDASKGMTRTFDNKYYLYPIPTDQIQLNSHLSQNYGW